jgi:hypothetical protein
MGQQPRRRVGDFRRHGNRGPSVIRREPGRSHHRVLNVVSLPAQTAIPVERSVELAAHG